MPSSGSIGAFIQFFLIRGDRVVWRDLRGGSPACELIEAKRPKDAAVLVLPKEPMMSGWRLGHWLGEAAGAEGEALPGIGIMIVCPICRARSFSM